MLRLLVKVLLCDLFCVINLINGQYYGNQFLPNMKSPIQFNNAPKNNPLYMDKYRNKALYIPVNLVS